MNLMAHAHKFFVFGGLLLLAIAAVQLLSRPRRDERAKATSLLDARTFRAIFYIVVGVLVLLAGMGVVPLPGDK
jgi:uncharacterized membrane protein YfcA